MRCCARFPRLGELVFLASIGADKLMRGFQWQFGFASPCEPKLPLDVTPHTLRHSFASVAADLGYSELTIASLLGHKKASVTSKYAHHADAVSSCEPPTSVSEPHRAIDGRRALRRRDHSVQEVARLGRSRATCEAMVWIEIWPMQGKEKRMD